MTITFGSGIAITGNTMSAGVPLGAPVVTTATVVSSTTATVTLQHLHLMVIHLYNILWLLALLEVLLLQ